MNPDEEPAVTKDDIIEIVNKALNYLEQGNSYRAEKELLGLLELFDY